MAMPEIIASFLALPLLVRVVAIFLAGLGIGFLVWLPFAIRLYFKLVGFTADITKLKRASALDPDGIFIKDPRLAHLWKEYRGTLHRPSGAIDPATGILEPGGYRATVPAEAIFNAQSLFEGRIHTEAVKHLPGLLTGLGIIGTFVGLIHGLGEATGEGGALDTAKLIHSVEEAFKVSAAAIFLAMVVTFIEKVLVAGLHKKVERLSQEIDALFSSGVGEEYLERLVRASEEASAQSKILKDALVGELKDILERLSQTQIAAAAQQQEQLKQSLVNTLQTGLTQPLGVMADGFRNFQGQQGSQLTQSLQDSMSAFADKLDQMLGGQIGQARELQAETQRSLSSLAASLQAMANDVGQAGASATDKMAASIGGALEGMAVRQEEMHAAMRQLAEELRGAVSESQSETQAHLGRVVEDLGRQMNGMVGQLQSQAQAASDAHGKHLAEVTSHARESVDALAEGVRAQTSAIGEVSAAVKAAVSELGSSVGRNVALMNEGAGKMRDAAEQFTTSGRSIGEVMDRSRETSAQLAQTTATLASASRDVRALVGDYQAARETFAQHVEALRGTVDIAKREVAMTSELVGRLEAAAAKLGAAQGQADEYLGKVSEVLAETHRSFGTEVARTLGNANTAFHQEMTRATGALSGAVSDLEEVLADLPGKSRH
jgi:ABC-type transporter Mla subunit MlaD